MTTRAPARERILDAFEELLIEQGERAATLDAVAARASVSKGGLLYHFGSKQALVNGLIERVHELFDADVVAMRNAPHGAVDYYIRTSVNCGTAFDRAIIATARLAQAQHDQASEAMTAMRNEWLATIEEEAGDPEVARVIVLMGDGLYANTAQLGMGVPDPRETTDDSLDRLVAVVKRLIPRD